MAKKPGQTRSLTGNDPTLKINLKEIFGIDFSDRPALKASITQEFIDTIVSRTQEERKQWTGTKMAGYSKEYAKTLEARATGKTAGQAANLTLTGSMLGTLDVVSETDNTVTLGWTESEEAEKAHGHITGSVGKVRDFFAVNSKEVDQIKREFSTEISIAKESDEATGPLSGAILALINRLGSDNDGGIFG